MLIRLLGPACTQRAFQFVLYLMKYPGEAPSDMIPGYWFALGSNVTHALTVNGACVMIEPTPFVVTPTTSFVPSNHTAWSPSPPEYPSTQLLVVALNSLPV